MASPQYAPGSGAAHSLAAMKTAAHPGDGDSSAVDSLARDAVSHAHDRLDVHAGQLADHHARLSKLENPGDPDNDPAAPGHGPDPDHDSDTDS